MSGHTPTVTKTKCGRCDGCGRLANTEDREPWTAWTSLPVDSAIAVVMGLVRPEPCDACGGTGEVDVSGPCVECGDEVKP